MVLALEPSVLLLDEPTAGLTKPERTLIGQILVDLAQNHELCIVLVEHDLDFVREISSRVIVLHQGRIVLDGTVAEVVDSELVRTIYSGGATCDRRPQLDARSRGVSSGYGEAVVVRDVALDIRPGEIFALLGKNGMGKSTLLKTVMGFLPIRSGTIRVSGEDITGQPPHRIARRAIAYTPQEQALFQDLTVEENLQLAVREREPAAGRAPAHGRDLSVHPPAAEAARGDALGRRAEDAADGARAHVGAAADPGGRDHARGCSPRWSRGWPRS